MSHSVKKLFLDDAYLTETTATVVEVNDRGGIVLDQTVFYGTSGGQPGDTGRLKRADGSVIERSASSMARVSASASASRPEAVAVR